jgi:3-deoxy-D-manno-octulosonic-acid transferase
MGELTLFLGAADAAFIGGSLVPHGGHNLLEAAAQGVPVVFGPHMFNFTEISELFLSRQAAVQVADGAELASLVGGWLQNASERSRIGENGRALVDRNRGALQRLTGLVARLVDQRNS